MYGWPENKNEKACKQKSEQYSVEASTTEISFKVSTRKTEDKMLH